MRKFSILILILSMIIMTGCTKRTDPELLNISVKVYDKEEKLVYDQKIETKKAILIEAIEDINDLQIISENSEYGKYITSIAGLKQGDNYYWNYYINDSYATVGAGAYKIKNNDKIEFKLEKFEEEA